MTVNALSPLKLILFGEHSVTKGEICLAIAINKFGCFTKSESLSPSITVIDTNNTKIDLSYLLNLNNANEEIIINLQRSIGCGLGTSASVSVLLAKYFNDNKEKINSNYAYIFDEETRIKEEKCKESLCTQSKGENTSQTADCNNKSEGSILNIALQIENLFHGKSSGVDVTTVFCSGMILYQNLRYTKLNTKFIKKYKILVYDSKIKKDTAKVIEKMKQNIGKICKNDIYVKMGEIANSAYLLLQSDFTLNEIYNLIKMNHDLLYELGVVPAKMQEEVLKLRAIGIESKITGAGCGGHLFTIVDKQTKIENWEEIEIHEE